jgi:hypothetical protein
VSVQYVALTQLGTILGTSRTIVLDRLAGIGLLTLARQPSEKALTGGFCKTVGTFPLWNRHRTIAALRATYRMTLATRADRPIARPPSRITARAITGDGDHRRDNDAYLTPMWVIHALLEVERFPGLTWEPAEGDGRIVQAFRRVGCDVIGSDLTTGTDFLKVTQEVDNIVTNPPWGLKTEFIQHGKQCAHRKLALLMPLFALSGVARRALFQDAAFPLRTVHVFVRRLNFHPDGKGSSLFNAGWFVWERGYQGEPVLRWV